MNTNFENLASPPSPPPSLESSSITLEELPIKTPSSPGLETFEEKEGFEGPEKKLEIIYAGQGDLRQASRKKWDEILKNAKCTIISSTSNEFFDSYVLSESSLFVYSKKIVVKTCGTTTLLNTVPALIELGKQYELKIAHVFFSHKNLNFPHRQYHHHQDFDKEIAFLNRHWKGSAYILGDKNSDHWHLFVANPMCTEPEELSNLEVMMSELPEHSMRQFFRNEDFVDAKTVTLSSGIDDILPGSTIDDFMFEPCGYSMNGLLGSSYSTIHVTPEAHCSFVSYETNLATPYAPVLQKVVDVFRPGKFSITYRVKKDARKMPWVHPEGYELCSSQKINFFTNTQLKFLTYQKIASEPVRD